MTAALERDPDRQSETSLQRGMYYPTRWDPYFLPYTTLADIYHYPTQHFEHHACQLSGWARRAGASASLLGGKGTAVS